jgi:hypothetical protein
MKSKLKSNSINFVDDSDNEFTSINLDSIVSLKGDESLGELVSKISTNNKTIVIDREIIVNENVTIPSNITLKFLSGGVLNGTGSVNINNYIDAPVGQTIFGGSLTTTGNYKRLNFNAENFDYDNTESGLPSSNIKGAIDDVSSSLIESGTIMLFGQNSPPTGWTRKNNWTNGSAIIYKSTGDIDSGGDTDLHGHTHEGPNHNHSVSDHSHTAPSHRHTVPTHRHSIGSHSHPAGSHTHTYILPQGGYQAPDGTDVAQSGENVISTGGWGYRQVEGNRQENTGAASGNTGNSSTFNSGYSGELNSAYAGNSSTSSNGPGSTGNAGTGNTGASTIKYQSVIAAEKD